MPGRDGTGPQGLGPATGRGFGRCTESNTRFNRSFGYGMGNRFRRFGNQRGFGYNQSIDELPNQNPIYDNKGISNELEKEITVLKDRIELLEQKLSKNND